MSESKSSDAPALFLVGLALGSVLTALLTPRNGDELRQTIKRRVETMRDTTKDAVDKVGDMADNKLDSAKDSLHRGRGKLNDELDNTGSVM